MRFILILLGIIVVAVGVVAFAGSRLPRDHEARMTMTVKAPVEQVWGTITDVRAYPSWRKDVKSVTIVTPAPLTWKEEGSQGPMTLTVDAWQPPRHMVARITDEDKPFGGSWDYVVEPDSVAGGMTRVTITESGWVSNPIFRFASKYVMGHHSSIDAYLRALSRKYGAEVTPTKVAVD